MSVFNEIGDRGGLNRVLQERLDMIGSAPAPSLMPEIAPCLVLENDRPEWGYLKGEFRFGRAVTSPAVVGQFSWAFLRNPAGSGLIMTMLQAIQTSTSVAVMTIGSTTPTTLSSSFAGNGADSRNPVQSQAFVGIGANAATPGGFQSLGWLSPNVNYTQPIILLPGWWALIVCQTANLAMNASFSWMERAALPGELV